MKKILLTALILISSLHSIFDYKLFILSAIFLIYSYFVYKPICSKRKRELFAVAALLILFSIYYIQPKLAGIETEESLDFYFSRTVLGLSIFWLLIGVNKYSSIKNDLTLALTITLSIHSIIFFITMYYAHTGSPLNLISLYSEALESRSNPLYYGSNIYRSNGLFNEPGTYAVVISILLAGRLLLINGFDKYGIIFLSTVVLTFSIQGVFLATSLLLFFVKREKINIKQLSIAGAFMLLVSYLIYEISGSYIAMRLSDPVGDISTLTRLAAFNLYMETEWAEKIIGSGLGVNKLGVLIADTGLFFSTMYFMGLTSMLLYYLYYRITKMKSILIPFMILLLFTKVELRYLALWILFGCIYLSAVKEGLHKSSSTVLASPRLSHHHHVHDAS